MQTVNNSEIKFLRQWLEQVGGRVLNKSLNGLIEVSNEDEGSGPVYFLLAIIVVYKPRWVTLSPKEFGLHGCQTWHAGPPAPLPPTHECAKIVAGVVPMGLARLTQAATNKKVFV
jgi:hypothetical protein